MTDAFFLAWKIPNIFRRVLGEGAFEKVLIPSLNGHFDKDYLSKVLFWTSLLSLCLASILSFLSEEIVLVFAPFAPAEVREDASRFLSVMAFYLPLIGLSAFFASLLQYGERFFTSYFHQVVFNATFILFLVLGYHPLGIWSLVFGVLVGGFFQLFYSLLAAVRAGVFVFPKVGWDKKVASFFRNILPSFASGGVGQISTLVEAFFATMAGGGVLSALYYAYRLYSLPVSLVGVAAGRVNLVEISKGNKSVEIYLKRAVQSSLYITVPVVIATFLAGESAVKIVYERGAFTAENTASVSLFLKLYILGLPAAVLYSLLSNLYYREGAFYRVFFLSLFWPITEILLSAAGIFLFDLGGAAVALAHSVGTWITFFVLCKDKGLCTSLIGWVFELKAYLPLWAGMFLSLMLSAGMFGQNFITFSLAAAWGFYFLIRLIKR